MKTGGPGKIRTCGIEFRRLAFCSTELRGLKWQGIGELNSGLRIENPASWPLDEYPVKRQDWRRLVGRHGNDPCSSG